MKKVNQSGVGHILVIAIIALAIISAGVVGYRVQQQSKSPALAAASAASYKPTGKVPGKNLSNIKRLAYVYWKTNSYSADRYRRADCKVTNVKLRYYSDKKDGAYARAYLGAAYKNNPVYNEKTPKEDYCIIHWNKRLSRELNMMDRCTTFVHEYGHLLGYDHNADPRNVMYSGYHNKGQSYELSTELWFKNKDYVYKATGCNTLPNGSEKI